MAIPDGVLAYAKTDEWRAWSKRHWDQDKAEVGAHYFSSLMRLAVSVDKEQP